MTPAGNLFRQEGVSEYGRCHAFRLSFLNAFFVGARAWEKVLFQYSKESQRIAFPKYQRKVMVIRNLNA